MEKFPFSSSVQHAKRPLLLITYAIALYFFFSRFSTVLSGVRFILTILSPFLLGGFMAFLLNITMSFLERTLLSIPGHEVRQRAKRPISLVLTLLIYVVVIAAVILLILPALRDTLVRIGATIPGALANLEAWLVNLGIDGRFLEEHIFSRLPNLQDVWEELLQGVQIFSTGVLSSTIGFVSSAITVITQFFIGIVFAIYLLNSKETLKRQFKMALYAHLPERFCDRCLDVCRLTSRIFSSFFSGQVTEACILGLMFFVSMTILRIPYALLISVLISITALIPVFGAFIGCITGALLILMISPVKALIFLVLFQVLQQIEGNLIYPHVVGGSVGLPAIWVLMAVSIGASLLGIAGMLFFIPLFSVIYTLFKQYTHRKLKESHVSPEKYLG